MPQLPTVGGSDGQWGQMLNDFLSVEHNANTGSLTNVARPSDVAAKYTLPGGGVPESDLAVAVQNKLNAADATAVHLAGTETVTGAKTFSGAATFTGATTVPTPSAANQAANKSYVDSVVVSGGTSNSFLIAAGNISGSYTLALASRGDVLMTATLTGSTTITITGMTAGCRFRMLLTQDATGNRVVTVSDGSSNVTVPVSNTPSTTSWIDGTSPDGTNLFLSW